MPSKAQRAASRQARLSRRKRRGKAAPQNFESGPTQSTAVSDADANAPSGSARRATSYNSSPAAGASTATAVAPSPRPALRARRRAVDTSAPTVSKFLPGEIRQIGIITSLIAVILAGLTFVLG